MPTIYLRARDHLQQAAAILRGSDGQSLQLLNIVERTISLIDDLPVPAPAVQDNVLDFAAFKARHAHYN
tara:strand:- start:3116 stop:3322 length:207 start_codon:yes stop_codon:yes gene_type:complete